MIRISSLGAVLSVVWATSSSSGICDYRLSQWISPKAATAAVTAGSAGATVGPATMAIGGLYFFPHATSGTLMLGSTLAGASGAGTIGIIGGSGFAATALAVLTAPITLLVAAGTSVTVGGLEAGCYFVDERITEEEKVLEILRHVALTANEDYFRLFEVSDEEAALTGTASRIRIPDESGEYQFFDVADLYIVNGELMHRDWFLNTPLGNIAAAVVTLR
ncbi:hypothetical protein [Histidinibacterium aquaticum]|uniref:Uncharacterized protein n=1 Tax=Histidinibacterium aquaticum TaxID=2613962 RepID=A0A5J5GQ67_9RHOB|nr:hypothetical protein [Histidinibacterium aquaticum]KAA9010330.1 hypothetical protein F3S47_03535 [Histidinibacterium aquaticum]